MHNRAERVWITWETQRRNRTLSEKVGAELYEFDVRAHRLLRYPLSLLKSLVVLIRRRPKLLFVQNPSLVLALFAVVCGRIFSQLIVVDSHNAGLFPAEGRNRWLMKLSTFIIRWAAITIVSNEGLSDYVRNKGGTAVAVPDPLPSFDTPQCVDALPGKANILFVCSWAEDEPYDEVLRAATLIDDGVQIHMTGSRAKAESRLGTNLPANISLTGFLSEPDYIAMLHACDLVMVLTTREDCLVCGAYEAVAAETPMILSDTAALRAYFSRGALYTNNTAEDIAKKITEGLEGVVRLRREVQELKRELQESFATSLAVLEHSLDARRSGEKFSPVNSSQATNQRQPV